MQTPLPSQVSKSTKTSIATPFESTLRIRGPSCGLPVPRRTVRVLERAHGRLGLPASTRGSPPPFECLLQGQDGDRGACTEEAPPPRNSTGPEVGFCGLRAASPASGTSRQWIRRWTADSALLLPTSR